ncbi:MAG: hypothetical protein AAFY20_08155 [Cyanobacteria bacterium J06639_14]
MKQFAVAIAIALTLSACQTPENHWQNALNAGWVAAVSAQTARTEAEWKTVVAQWSAAIAELKQVPENSNEYAQVQAKVEEYEANRGAANQHMLQARTTQPESIDASEDPTKRLAAFRASLSTIGPDSAIVADVSYMEADDKRRTILIEVNDEWLSHSKSVRLRNATKLQQIWALHRDPESLDRAYIKIESATGQHVGGSRAIDGSIIWVED